MCVIFSLKITIECQAIKINANKIGLRHGLVLQTWHFTWKLNWFEFLHECRVKQSRRDVCAFQSKNYPFIDNENVV